MANSGKVKFGITSNNSRNNSSSSAGGAGAGIGNSATFYHTQTTALKGNRISKRGDADEDDNNFVEDLL